MHATRPCVSRAWWGVVAGSMFAASLAGAGCGGTASSPGPGGREERRIVADTDAVRAVRQAGDGNVGEAIEALLRLREAAPAARERWRLSELREIDCPTMDPNALAQARVVLLELTTQARDLVNELDRRAKAAQADGRTAEAERLFGVMQSLAAANRGSDAEVAKLVGFLGDYADKRARDGLAGLLGAETKPAGP